MRKGRRSRQVLTVVTNAGSGQQGTHEISLSSTQTGFGAREPVVEVLRCGRQATQADGTLVVRVQGGEPQVFMSQHMLAGSRICQG